jgi:hypothetical protein
MHVKRRTQWCVSFVWVYRRCRKMSIAAANTQMTGSASLSDLRSRSISVIRPREMPSQLNAMSSSIWCPRNCPREQLTSTGNALCDRICWCCHKDVIAINHIGSTPTFLTIRALVSLKSSSNDKIKRINLIPRLQVVNCQLWGCGIRRRTIMYDPAAHAHRIEIL